MAAAGSSAFGFAEANSLAFSQRHSTLHLPSCLGERAPRDVAFDASGGSLLGAFGKPRAEVSTEGYGKRDAHTLARAATGGLMAVWRLYRPEAPWAVMRVVGVPTCCLIPPAKPHLAFAGTESGSVQLWNLREPSSSHPSVAPEHGGGDRITLRQPTYASDCLANANAHVSPITHLEALPVAGGVSDDASELTIGSLDEEGILILWVVLEAVDVDASDLGQAVGGKERLLRTGTVELTADPFAAHGLSGGLPSSYGGGRGAMGGASGLAVLPTRCVHFGFVPLDPSRLLLATDLPQLLHRSRFTASAGSAPVPLPTPEKFAPASERAASAGVSGFAFCPTSPAHFVAARTDGSIALYHVDDAQPLLSWAGFAKDGITQLRWSPSRPCVIWALDGAESLHAIDITDPNNQPFVSSKTANGNAPPPGMASRKENGGAATADDSIGRPLRFALDMHGAADGGKGGAQAAGGVPKPHLVATVARYDGVPGAIEVHVLTEACATPTQHEAKKLATFLQRL